MKFSEEARLVVHGGEEMLYDCTFTAEMERRTRKVLSVTSGQRKDKNHRGGMRKFRKVRHRQKKIAAVR